MPALERGPNLNLFDQIEPIRESPLYNAWRDPVPPEWYTINRRAYTLVDQDALYGSLLYSRNYGRTSSETLSSPTDVAIVAATSKLRLAGDGLFVPTEGVGTTRTFIRSGVESLAEPTESLRSVRNQGALVSPTIDIYP